MPAWELSNKRWFFPAAIILLWVIAIAVVNPAGEFAIVDDWSYARNVYWLAVDKTFYVHYWPAMILISQTLYGTLVALIFGFSFTALRFSVLFLAILATLALYSLMRRKTGHGLTAFLLACGFCFSPLFFSLSFSFMTDVFFLSFLIFSVYFLVRYIEAGKTVHYIFYILCCLMTAMNRQHGLLLPVLIIFPLLWRQKITLKKLMLAGLPALLCFTVHYGYTACIKSLNIPLSIRGLDFLLEDMKRMSLKMAAAQAGDFLMVAGWMLLPCSLALAWKRIRPGRKLLAPLLLSVGICGLVAFFAFSTYPMGPIATLEGIGPKMLKDYEINILGRFHVPGWFKNTVRSLCIASLLVSLVSLSGAGRFKFKNGQASSGLQLAFFFFLLVYTGFSMMNASYFDRYVMPMALIFMIIIAPEAGKLRPSYTLPLVSLVLLIFITSVLQEKDYLSWHRTKAQALKDLHAKGLGEHDIDGGFEYNGWYQAAGGFTTEKDGRSWWWVDHDYYLIANGLYSGYNVKRVYPYQHYLPYVKDTLFVLEQYGYDRSLNQDSLFNERIRKIELQATQDTALFTRIKQMGVEKRISADSSLHGYAIWWLNELRRMKLPLP